jgi:hypothetical protein
VLTRELTELFYVVDSFCVFVDTQLLPQSSHPGPKPSLYPSESITVFRSASYWRFRDFKAFYTLYARRHLRREFPRLVSYSRFVEPAPGPRRGEELDAAHLRHHDVDEDEGERRQRGEPRERLLTTRGDEERVARLVDDIFEGVPEIGVVLDQEQRAALGEGGSGHLYLGAGQGTPASKRCSTR